MIRAFLFYFLTTVSGILMLPFFLFAIYVVRERRFTFMWTKCWVYFSLYLLRKLNKLDYKILGEDKIKTPCIIASKHQSVFETMIYFMEWGEHSVFVLKKSLFRWPVLGMLLKHTGMIGIPRDKPIYALQQMQKLGKQAIQDNKNIIIFPEGTRTEPGEKIKYSDGVYLLYARLKVPVVTVGVNTGLFWPRHMFKKIPGCASIIVNDIIMPGLSREAFMQSMEDSIEKASRCSM